MTTRAERTWFVDAEAEDRHFWQWEWSGITAELLQLRDAVESTTHRGMSLTQAGNTSQAEGSSKHFSPLAGIKLNLNPKTTADLVPALAMLKSLYEDGKERISTLNAREKKYKQQYDDRLAVHNKRMAEISAQTLSADFKANETRDENRLWNYSEQVRERQHRQFHTSLKIQHGTLEKVKSMMDMYEKAIAGKDDKAQQELARVASGHLPEVVLLQEAWKATATYCKEALAEAHIASAELRNGEGLLMMPDE